MGPGQVEQSEGLASSCQESTKDMKSLPKLPSGTQAPPLGFNYDIKLIQIGGGWVLEAEGLMHLS
jgi:hypothetical protein